MKFPRLMIFIVLTLSGICHAEELEFFEKKYKTKITGVEPIESYSDPDLYYTAIANELGIFQKAYDAVFEKYGWGEGENKTRNAMVKRGEGAGRWEFMVVQCSIDPKTKKPDMRTLEMKLVFIDDDGKAHFPELPDREAKLEQAAGQPGTTPKSKSEGKGDPRKTAISTSVDADEKRRQEMIKKIEQTVRELKDAGKHEKAAAHARRLTEFEKELPEAE